MKKGLFVLGICIGLICSGLFVSNASADSTATISITIYRILKIDEIENAWLVQGEADWFYHVGVSEDGGNTFIWQHSTEPIQQNKDDLIVNEIHTFSGIKSATLTIAIMLCEDDVGSSDIADISSDSSGGTDFVADSIQPPSTGWYGGTYIGYYNLKTNKLSGDTIYVEEGYHKTSGDYDGSTSIDQNDAAVWFNIEESYNAPVAYAGYDKTANAGDKVNFDASGSTHSVDIERYQWDFESDGIWDAEGEQTSYTYNTANTYVASLKITDSLGETSTDTFNVKVITTPNAAFVYSPKDNPNPTTSDTIQFTDTSTIVGGTFTSWSWDFGDGESSTNENPTHKYSQGGTYTVKLTVAANDGETDSNTAQITVTEKGTPGFELVLTFLAIIVVSIILLRKKK
jgi:plastocyanin